MILGRTLCEQFDEYHCRNPRQLATGVVSSNMNAQMMYEIIPILPIQPVTPSQSTYITTTTLQPINQHQLTQEACIETLEWEFLALRKKQVFDGVEITHRPERLSPNEQASPAATQVPQNCVTTTDPPVGHIVPVVLTPVVEPPIHPYSTVPES
jgi:hypothetical protein